MSRRNPDGSLSAPLVNIHEGKALRAFLDTLPADKQGYAVEVAPRTEWPYSAKDTDTFFREGEGKQWFDELPEKLKEVWSWELYHGSYKAFATNTQTAYLLETRRDDLAGFLLLLETEGLSLDALLAFERVSKGNPPFNEHHDHRLPRGYRSTDEEAQDD